MVSLLSLSQIAHVRIMRITVWQVIDAIELLAGRLLLAKPTLVMNIPDCVRKCLLHDQQDSKDIQVDVHSPIVNIARNVVLLIPG